MPADVAATLLEYNTESIVEDKIRNAVKFGGEKLVESTYRESKGHEYVFHFVLDKAQINDLNNNGLRVDKDIINRAILQRHKQKPPFAVGGDLIALKNASIYIDDDGTPFAGVGNLEIMDNHPDPGSKTPLFTFPAAQLATAGVSFWGTNDLPSIHQQFPNNGGGEFIIQATEAITGGGTNSRIVVKIVCESNRWIIPPGI